MSDAPAAAPAAALPVAVEPHLPPTKQKGFGSSGLILITIVGLAVSLLWLIHDGRNYQETFNLSFAKTRPLNPVTQASADNPMPLYFLLVHGLAHWFSPTLLDLRLFSLFCYFLLLPLMYIAGKTATDDTRVGVLAAILLGLSPFMLWYGNRATMYALLALITVLNQWLFSLILLKKKWLWPLYIVTGLVGLGVHYFFVVILLSQLVFYTIKRRALSRAGLITLLVCGLFFAVCLAAWLHYLSASNLHIFRYLPYTSKPSATNAFIIYVQFLFGFQSVVTTTFVIAFWPLLVVLALLAVQKYVRPPIVIQYFSFAAFMPVLCIFALSWLWRPLFLSSYFIVSLPAFMLLTSWYLVAFELKALLWARNVILGVMVGMLVFELLNPSIAIREDYLGLAAPRNHAAETIARGER